MAADVDLHGLASDALVDLAVRENHRVVEVAEELERRAPDREAFEAIRRAYESRAMAPWMAALLLGRARVEAGYAQVRAILLEAPGLLAESYAGVALARIGGEPAFDDLAKLMMEAPRKASREGAADGLGSLRRAGTAALVLRAAREGRIRPETAASAVGDTPDARLAMKEWLGGDDTLAVRIATYAVAGWLARENAVVSLELVRAFEATVRSGRVKQSPSTREHRLELVRRVVERS